MTLYILIGALSAVGVLIVVFMVLSWLGYHYDRKKLVDAFSSEKDELYKQINFLKTERNRLLKSEYPMTMNTYQILAARTINKNLSDEEQLRHGLLGLAGECGEVTSIFQKQLQGNDVDLEVLVKEMGDVMWMLAEIATVTNITLDDVASRNIEKLKKRYPNGFSVEDSKNRDESKE